MTLEIALTLAVLVGTLATMMTATIAGVLTTIANG